MVHTLDEDKGKLKRTNNTDVRSPVMSGNHGERENSRWGKQARFAGRGSLRAEQNI